MRSHLKAFVATLEGLDTPSKVIARKLSIVNTHRNLLPQVSWTLWYLTAQYSTEAVQQRDMAATGLRASSACRRADQLSPARRHAASEFPEASSPSSPRHVVENCSPCC